MENRSDQKQTRATRVLIADTDRRAYAVRLAIQLAKAGCEVSALVSAKHPINSTRSVSKVLPYNPLRPVDALQSAIEETAPAFIIPCCDRSVSHAHTLHARASVRPGSEDLCALLERSLGKPESFTTVGSRYDLLRLAQELGIRTPVTTRIQSPEDLGPWSHTHAFPWVLKSDGSWGGRGVRVAYAQTGAEQDFDDIRRPFRLGRVLKRCFVNRDPFWIRPWWEKEQPDVIVQSYVQGRPANCGALCWQGKVLALIAVEVVCSDGATGPASVVRVVDSPAMSMAAEKIAGHLGLSGFFGLDFMIDDKNDTYLIEMNPRCTPVCHLQLGPKRDLVESLVACLTGSRPREVSAVTTKDLIAYFPQAEGLDSELLASCYQDVPQEEVGVQEALRENWPSKSFLFTLTNFIHRLGRARRSPQKPPSQPRVAKALSYEISRTGTSRNVCDGVGAKLR